MLRHVLDLPEICSRNYRATASDFLDPYELSLVTSLAVHFPSVEAFIFPEGEWERKIVVFAPYDVEDEFLTAFHLDGSEPMDHRQVLGSILGLGIERSKIGDISTFGDEAYVFVKKEVASFLAINLRKIGSMPICIREIAPADVPFAEEAWIEAAAVVSSMRLDSVVRAVTHKSRDEVKGLIAKGLIKINFRRAEKPHEMISGGDLLSVRGFGRIKIFEPLYTTKKGKVRFRYGTLNSR